MALTLPGIDAKGIEAIQGPSALQSILNAPEIIRNLKQQHAQQEMAKQLQQQQLARGGAQTQLYQAQAQKLLHPAFDYKNPMSVYQEAKRRYDINPNDPQIPVLMAIYHKSIDPKKGISVSTSPQGGTQVQIGGPAGAAQPGGLQMMPGTKAGRGEKGATFYDPKTGEVVSSPTLPETTKLQQSILGEQQVHRAVSSAHDVLDEMKSNNVGFFNPLTHILSALSPAIKYQYPKAAQAASGILGVKGFVNKAAERYMATSNLPKTRGSLEKVISILMPTIRELPSTYTKRVGMQLTGLEQDTSQRKAALRSNIPVGTRAPQPQLAPAKGFNQLYGVTPRARVPQQLPAKTKSISTKENITEADLAATSKATGMTRGQIIDRLKKEGRM